MKIHGVKDPNKIRQSILGDKHKATEPACIKHPKIGELVTTPEEIKKVTLNHNLKILLGHKTHFYWQKSKLT